MPTEETRNNTETVQKEPPLPKYLKNIVTALLFLLVTSGIAIRVYALVLREQQSA